MDARLLRPNQMTFAQPHLAASRSHYSTRQQQPSSQQPLASTSSSSDDDQRTISEKLGAGAKQSATNTKTSHQQPAASMVVHANGKQLSQHQQHLMMQQQQQHHHQHQQQKQRQMQQQQQQLHQQQQQQQQHHSNRQAALHQQPHHLGAQGLKSPYARAGPPAAHNASASSADNMTSSSSDHTIDDLQHLAHGFSHRRLHGGAERAAASSQSGSRFLLGVLFTLAEILLFTTVVLWLYWAYQHDDGLAWQNDRKQQFNTHAALMLVGFVFLNGQAMLVYRSFQCCSKIYTKILHTILFVLATSAISLGLILGYTAQENVGPSNKPIMHFYSLHAWAGLTTIGLFVLQFVFGFVSFLILLCCDNATSKFRAALLPIHKTFGLIIFSLAVATCLTGLLQTARSRLSSKLNKVDYHELGEAGIVINLIGLCLIFLAILMPYIIRNLDIKRPFRFQIDRHLKSSQLEMRL